VILPFLTFSQEWKTLIVCDSTLGDVLPMAHIINVSKASGQVTNERGSIRLSVMPEDVYKVSFVGFETKFLSGFELQKMDTVHISRQVKSLTTINISGEQQSARELIKKAKKKYKKLPNSKSLVFKGYFEEICFVGSDTHRLRCVFNLTNYDNMRKVGFTNFMDYPELFALIGLEKTVAPAEDNIMNGLRWLTPIATVLNNLRGRREWDSERIDSVKQDGEHLLFWVSTHTEKWGPQLKILIDDEYNILYLENLGTFAQVIRFDPTISLAYPVYIMTEIDHTDKFDVYTKQVFHIWLLEEISNFNYDRNQCMPGDKMYDEESKSMWHQEPIEPNFDWSGYDPIWFYE